MYLLGDSVRGVLCDRPYEADDYLRDYDQFQVWRESAPMNEPARGRASSFFLTVGRRT